MLTIMSTYFRRIPAYIKRYVYIDESIPQLLRWKRVLSNRVKPGDPVGCLTNNGKSDFFKFGFNKKVYLNHRVYYFLKTGKDPGEATNEHPKGAVVSPTELRPKT